MATRQINEVIQHLCRTVLGPDQRMTDGQLLESFIAKKDAEAFQALVRRHGSMVLSVCRRLLRNHHDAEDAFQAVFLVLTRKASTIKPREMVANWLHGVAQQTAQKANAMNTKRRVREKQVRETPEPTTVQPDPWNELEPLLDRELTHLPEKYRLPVILCDLEGKSIKEATRQLGCPQGTLAGRLSRGRTMLAKRLTQHGVVLSGGSLAVLLSKNTASASMPTSLVVSTVKTVSLIAAKQATVGVISPKVVALMEGVMKAMLLTKLKSLTTVLCLLLLFGVGIGAMSYTAAASGQPDDPSQAEKKEDTPTPVADNANFTIKAQGNRLIMDGTNAEGSVVRVHAVVATYQKSSGTLTLEGTSDHPLVVEGNGKSHRVKGMSIKIGKCYGGQIAVVPDGKNLTEIPETEVVVRLGQLYRLQMSDKKRIKTISNGYSQLVQVRADDDSPDGSSVVLTPYHISTAHFALISSDGIKEYFRVVVTADGKKVEAEVEEIVPGEKLAPGHRQPAPRPRTSVSQEVGPKKVVKPKQETDEQLIEGTWIGVDLEYRGLRLSEKSDAKSKRILRNWKLVFSNGVMAGFDSLGDVKRDDDHLTIEESNPSDDDRVTYTLDPSAQPKRIDLIWKGQSGVQKEERAKGIYSLRGDTLIIAFEDDKGRPDDFRTDDDSRLTVFTLRRQPIPAKGEQEKPVEPARREGSSAKEAPMADKVKEGQKASDSGWLRRAPFWLDQKRTYVLESNQGMPRMYVTALAGVNLDPFIGRNVNLSGTVLYRGELKKYHMIASEVTLVQPVESARPEGSSVKESPKTDEVKTGQDDAGGDFTLAVAYSRDGKLVAAAGHSGSVRLWDPRTGKLVRKLGPHKGTVRAMAFSPVSRFLASAGDDKVVIIWDPQTGAEGQRLTGHAGDIDALQFSPDGTLLATSSVQIEEGEVKLAEVKLWDLDAGKVKRTWKTKGYAASLAFSPDGKTLAVADGKLKLWNVESGELKQTFSFASKDSEVQLVAFSPDGKTIVGGGGTYETVGQGTIMHGQVCLWDVHTRKQLLTITGVEDWLRAIAFSPDGKSLATGSSSPVRTSPDGNTRWVPSRVMLWDTRTGKRLWESEGNPGEVWSITFSPDGKKILTGDNDVTLFNSQSGARDKVLMTTR